MLFVFDWDGTLCDSTQKIAFCMIRAAYELGLPPITEAEVFNIIGLGLPEAIRVLYPHISDADLARLKAGYSQVYLEQDQAPPKLFDGVEETLEALKSSGVSIAIATGKSRRGLNRVLASLGWEDYFDGSRCADETASKPHPLMLFELLEEFNCSAGDAVLIGDTEYDMEMAVKASMPRIAVSYGAHAVERLTPYQPSLCVDHIGSVLAYLEPIR